MKEAAGEKKGKEGQNRTLILHYSYASTTVHVEMCHRCKYIDDVMILFYLYAHTYSDTEYNQLFQ